MTYASPIRVLVAEDHGALRAALERLLSGAGFDVVACAADGAGAVALSGRHRPDVVVLGLRMPGLDGVQATRRILAERAGARVLVLTGAGRACDVRAALAAGAVDCVAKDEGPETLIARIRAAADAPPAGAGRTDGEMGVAGHG